MLGIFQLFPEIDQALKETEQSWYFIWHAIMYLLITLIAILLCCPLAYCCCYKRYRKRKIARRLETEVTMPRLMDSSLHEMQSGSKPFNLFLAKG